MCDSTATRQLLAEFSYTVIYRRNWVSLSNKDVHDRVWFDTKTLGEVYGQIAGEHGFARYIPRLLLNDFMESLEDIWKMCNQQNDNGVGLRAPSSFLCKSVKFGERVHPNSLWYHFDVSSACATPEKVEQSHKIGSLLQIMLKLRYRSFNGAREVMDCNELGAIVLPAMPLSFPKRNELLAIRICVIRVRKDDDF